MDTNKIYELLNKVGQRFAFGASVHHPALASAYEALGMPQFTDMNKDAAKKEAKKRCWVDDLLVKITGRVPNYEMPTNIQTATKIMGTLTKEQIAQNKTEILKKLIALQADYEKNTITLLEQLKEANKDLGGQAIQFLTQVIEEVKDELEDIEYSKQMLEKVGYDTEKLKKGEHHMNYPTPEHEEHEHHELLRRHHMEREDLQRKHDHEHQMYRRRHYRHHGEYPMHSDRPMGYGVPGMPGYMPGPYGLDVPTHVGDSESEHEARRRHHRRYY